IRLRGVDFEQGAKKFEITAAADGKCTVSIRVDAVDGTEIAKLDISKTASLEKYKAFSAKVGQVSGVHDLYICFDQAEGNVRLDWWQFKK
ncbi:MAG: carbohydrate-binding protein, partial [Bacteroidaceae bacterium]